MTSTRNADSRIVAHMDFSGRVALVTGGARGIGLAVASQLAQLGAAVAIGDIDEEGAQAAAAQLEVFDSPVMAAKADVGDFDEVERMVDDVQERMGKVDILIHSAGIGVERAFLETSPQEWQRLIDVDLSGTFYCAQAAARRMIVKGYGRIVTLASTAGLRGGTGRAAYGAAKGGVVALTKVMAVELAEYGVTANALAPGAIETELVARMHSDKTRRAYRAGIPMDRYGTPPEVASAAVYLASEAAGYITGQVLGVDGGFLAAGVMIR